MRFFPDAATTECRQALDLLHEVPLLSSFYLAGGTALALQLGHRVSTDLDWFSSTCRLNFQERDSLRHSIQAKGLLEEVREQDGQFYCRFASADVSFLHQPHPLSEAAVEYQGVALASPTDIGLMKLAAINSRGTRRDFVDLYCLRNLVSIQQLAELALIKYFDRPTFLDITVRALAYFVDAEQQPMPRLLWNNVEWKAVVQYCREGAKWLAQFLRDKNA